jgi:hypothetical protein
MYCIYGPPVHQKEEIHTIASCVNTAFEILTFCVLILLLHFNFNLDYFNNTKFRLTVIQGVTGGMCETSGECSLGQTIPI